MSTHKKNKKTAKIATLILLLIFAVVGYFVINNYVQYRIYQLNHKDTIKEMSEKYDLDPYMVCAVIYTESKFDDDVVSNAGAVGLMQIMPNTGEWIAKKAKFSDYTDDSLKDPAMNIKLGCWYLNYLETKFNGSVQLMLASYNAGPSNVSSWLGNTSYSSDGKTLTKIPYKETENYVTRVMNAYERYKSLYKDTFN